ncbi:orotate phosphoribosyltransferase [Clostridium sp. 'White wine YQ']|uniref:orotate phosphoribosyltransferase n=1 Tax=Clostridium sp. 'White wine YQ' TaxID=3027474 RepID=UPI002366B6CC|nr:orotate phosphoribosyltransferase [Clostridium sp. 'White wine YQ']MDD7793229.1 orotate phosphoribosyltransferase [Clostridium sp. 'White wine YQ']
MEGYKKEFIDFMIECGVLTFGDFVTKSGRKTPFFINTGNYKTGSQLSRLGDFYAKAIKENFHEDFNIVFGPAYKGIPLSVATTISLSKLYDIDINYCSNRKEVKDHGDTGILLGSKIKDGDKILIVEDVTTAGTSIYETMPILEAQGKVEVKGLIISVDRMEKGKGEESALKEIRDNFGFKTCAIVTMEEVVEYLYNKEVNGQVLIDDNMKSRIEDYYKVYGTK